MRVSLCVLLVGCVPSFKLLQEQHVTCTTDADCPVGSTCRTLLFQCVPSGTSDDEAPSAIATLTPARGNAATAFTVKLVPSETLAYAPKVSSDLGEFTLASDDFTYRWVPSGNEPEGNYIVTADLVDAFGNPTTLTVGTFTLDYTAPSFANVQWVLDKPDLAANDAFSLTGEVETDATIMSARLLSLDGALLLALNAADDSAQTPAGYKAFKVSGSLQDANMSGVEFVTLELRALDSAGNLTPASSVLSAPRRYDAAPPSNVTVDFVGGVLVTSQATQLTLSALGATSYRLEGDVSSDWTSAVFPTTIAVVLSSGDGVKAVTGYFRDDAHNQAVATASVQLTAGNDTMAPRVETLSVNGPFGVELTFNEFVATSSAIDASHYSVQSASVLQDIVGVTLLSQQKVLVTLTDAMVGQQDYTLNVVGVEDLSGNAILPTGQTLAFRGFGPAPETTPPNLIAPQPDERRKAAALPLSLELAWTARTGVSQYEVIVATVPTGVTGFTSVTGPVVYYTSIAGTGLQAPDNRTTVSNLSDSTYYVTLRSDLSDWSVPSAFHVLADTVYVACVTEFCLDSAGFGTRNRPLQSIHRAVNVAAGQQATRVNVAPRGGTGAYIDTVNLVPSLSLYGGYDAVTWARSATGPTIIGGNSSIGVTAIGINGISGSCVFDGFTLHGDARPTSYGMFVSDAQNALVVSNNVIFDPAGNMGSSTSYGVYLANAGSDSSNSPYFHDNTITGGDRLNGGGNTSYGAYLNASGARFVHNTISAGQSSGASVGVAVVGGGQPVFDRNTITGFTTGAALASKGQFTNNLVQASGPAGSQTALSIEGLPGASADYKVANNTLVSTRGPAVYSNLDESMYAANIIVAPTGSCFTVGPSGSKPDFFRNALVTCPALSACPPATCYDNVNIPLGAVGFTGGYHLSTGTTGFVRLRGDDFSEVQVDLEGVSRQCSAPPLAGATSASTSVCHSLGAYEFTGD